MILECLCVRLCECTDSPNGLCMTFPQVHADSLLRHTLSIGTLDRQLAQADKSTSNKLNVIHGHVQLFAFKPFVT
jgi:hypothetical protein